MSLHVQPGHLGLCITTFCSCKQWLLFVPSYEKKRSGPGPLMFMFLRRRGENVSTKHNLLSLLFITKLSQLIKKDWIGTFVFFLVDYNCVLNCGNRESIGEEDGDIVEFTHY